MSHFLNSSGFFYGYCAVVGPACFGIGAWLHIAKSDRKRK